MTPPNFLKPLLNFHDYKKPLSLPDIIDSQKPITVEIGFGMGEVLVDSAKKYPDRHFIGIEQHWERLYKTLKSVSRWNDSCAEDQVIDNVSVLDIDARIAFEKLFAEKSLDHIYCLFPCPWPKKSHVKHRLFSEKFLSLLNNRLKDDATIRIVTDYYPYFSWIQEEVPGVLFDFETQTVQPQFGTKFEKKWQEEGQEEFFEILLKKKQHVELPNKGVIELKSYRLEQFDYKKFDFENQKGRISVILKDRLYDADIQKAMLHMIIAEPDMTQHLWVEIFYADNIWRVKRADGQQFFPTEGISFAIKSIYEAAQRSY